MDLQVTTATGKAAGTTVSVSDTTFARDFNEALVHQVITAYLAGARSGTRGTKSRADARGGGAKPWRQKGTGRARAGSSNSPIWRGGGKAFAFGPQDHSQKVNKKMYRSAIRAILSELVRQERLIVVDELKPASAKTKDFAQYLKNMGLDDVMIIVDDINDNLALASRNLYKVGLCSTKQINPVALVGSEKVLMTVSAVNQVEEMLG